MDPQHIDPNLALAAKDAGPLLAKMFEGTGTALLAHAGNVAKSVIDRLVADFGIGFNDFLTTSYNKSHIVKTLLSQDRPLSLLSAYVHLHLECRDQKHVDDELIGKLTTYRHVVITGLAGCGKSMFMKYLTVSRFEKSDGIIPLFIELRQINTLTSKDLLSFIFFSSASANKRVTREQFDLALKAGAFMLILDGFDEVEHAHRNEIAKQILELAIKYPELPVVVSSRPDPQFGSWNPFFVFKVRELSKKQVLELIERIDYDKDLKMRFAKEIDRSLYSSHGSFLSSPLLASIMLLTYEQFAEIPNKMHIFYEQAFETLFRRHDAQKAQYIRKTYSGLAIDDFKRFFAAFCAMTYLTESFSFSDQSLSRAVKKALDFTLIKAKPAEVVADLRECVCMLQRDGLHTVFVHRSFQEYFSAVFLATYHGARFGEVIEKFLQRDNDNVLPMIFDMAREKIEQEWALPRIDGLLNIFRDETNRSRVFTALVSEVELDIRIHAKGSVKVGAPMGDTGENFNPCALLFKLYPHISKVQLFPFVVREGIEQHARQALMRAGATNKWTREELLKQLGVQTDKSEDNPDETKKNSRKKISAANMSDRWIHIDMSPEFYDRLAIEDVIVRIANVLENIRKEIQFRMDHQQDIIDLLV
jgi:NACHT domain